MVLSICTELYRSVTELLNSPSLNKNLLYYLIESCQIEINTDGIDTFNNKIINLNELHEFYKSINFVY